MSPDKINKIEEGEPASQVAEVEVAPAQIRELELPVPLRSYPIDREQAKFLFTTEETDPEIKQIKEKVIGAVEHVSFQEFKAALGRSVARFNESMKGHEDKYMAVFDYKPHSSRRWVYGLAKEGLEQQPEQAHYFGPAMEKMGGFKRLDKDIDAGVRKFAIFDDAAYSGEQVFNRTINPIVERFKEKGIGSPEFDIVVPFMTTRARTKFEEFARDNSVVIRIHVDKIMPTLLETLEPQEREALARKRGGRLDTTSDGEVEEPSYLGATVTYFDHRVADDWSFAAEVKKVAKLDVPKPYADQASEYYKAEEEEFAAYQNSFKS